MEARRGAFVQFDTMGGSNAYDREQGIQLVRRALDAGLLRHLLLSHDVCYRSMLVAYGGTGYAWLSTEGPRALGQVGVGTDEFRQLMVENPRRALTGED